MVPKIKPKFTKQDIDKYVKDRITAIENAIVSMLQKIGEDFVSNGRNMGAYRDQTGNLRSSVGYVILKYSLQLHKGGFVKITAKKKPGAKLIETISGAKAGDLLVEQLKKEFAEKYRNAIVLVGVAGMDYAIFVESKGLDVITGSSQIAAVQLKESVERLRSKILKAA
jgi:hypothetical protein